MNYWTAGAALVCLSISSILLLAGLGWMVKRQQQRLPLAYLLGLICLIVIQSLEFLYHATDLFRQFPFFLKLADPAVVMIPFCIYGYIRALQGDNVLARHGTLWLHLLPMLVVALLAIPFWSLPPQEKVHWMLMGRQDYALWEPITLYGNPYLAVTGGLSLFYWLRQRQQGVASRKAAVVEWVSHVQSLQLVIVISLSARIALFYLLDIRLSISLVLAPATAYLTYLMLTRLNLPVQLERPAAATRPQASCEPIPVTDTSTEALLFAELEKAMAAGLYRDNDLTLGKLANHCGLSTHQASSAINLHAGGNFYEWVNRYRVEDAAQALRNTDLPVTRICHDAGFNAKSTFNTAFRRHFHCTPTQYRKQAQRSSDSGRR